MQVRADLPLWSRIGAVPAAAALTVAGIWVAGGVLTDDFRASMALTALWFAAVVGGAMLLWARLPGLRAAALAAVLTFAVVGAVLALGTVRDRVVDESVASGPAALSGSFEARAHATEGRAAVVESGGRRLLTLTGFRTDAGPDLFVYLVPGRTGGDSVSGGVRLGSLKGKHRRPAVRVAARMGARRRRDRRDLVPRLQRLLRRRASQSGVIR